MEPLEELKPSAWPEGTDHKTYYLSEARPLGELRPLWRKFADEITFQKWLTFRDHARKNLFWLGQKVLGKDLVKWHMIPCYKMFVQKNFDGVYRAGYTIGEVHAAIAKQKREKEMLFFASRGSFKSTLDGIDCVQWLLNCPDIRILILTGEYKLALAFMSEIKGYFFRPEDTPCTYLQKLFPEYILEGKDPSSDSPLRCPARIHISQKEPSIWVNAIVANLSGWHCDIRKIDDVVTDENSNNPDTRGKDGTLKKKIDGTDNLVDEWGFTDMMATPYYNDDYYGERLKTRDEVPLVFGRFPGWTVKAPYIGTPLKDLTEDMVDLLFPEKLSFKSLRQKLRKNENLFRCQQLCEPAADGGAVTFTEDVLKAHLVSKAPAEGDTFIAWDWSFSRSSYADFSAGVAGRIVPGEDRFDLYITEIIFGRWRPSELAYQMVQFEKKWKPKCTIVEKSMGAELLQMEVARQAQKFGVALNILWKVPSNEKDAKRNRIKGVETLLANDNLWFVGGAWIDETFEQLMRFTGDPKNRGRKDDIPDALAYMQHFCPSTKNNEELKKMQQDREHKAEQKAIYASIFDSPVYVAPAAQPIPMRKQLFGPLAR